MKKIVGVVLCLLLTVCLLFGCSTQTVEKATDTMLEHGFEAWENPEIPISMLGLSEDEVKADGRYTKSTSESETYDAEYTIELNTGKEITLQMEEGRITRTSFFQMIYEPDSEFILEFFEGVDALREKYGEPKILLDGSQECTLDELMAIEVAGMDYFVSFSWFQDDLLIGAHHSRSYGYEHNSFSFNTRD